MRPPGELQVLLVEEELLREAAEVAKDVAAGREGGAARVRDLARLRQGVGGVAIAAGPGEPAHMHDVATRVQALRILQQAEPRLHDADVRLLERTRERRDGARLDD